MEHIQVHRWYMGEKHQHPIDEERAARSSYKKVYLPLVQIVRDMNILADFPGRSEADLYLWIIERQYFLTERSSELVPLDQAALHFVNRYSTGHCADSVSGWTVSDESFSPIRRGSARSKKSIGEGYKGE